jgi:flagellar biosynthesis protein FliR
MDKEIYRSFKFFSLENTVIFGYLLIYYQGGLAELLEFGLELAMPVT